MSEQGPGNKRKEIRQVGFKNGFGGGGVGTTSINSFGLYVCDGTYLKKMRIEREGTGAIRTIGWNSPWTQRHGLGGGWKCRGTRAL